MSQLAVPEYGVMQETQRDDILALYGLCTERWLPAQSGYRNWSFPFQLASGQWGNLMLYKHEPGIAARIRRANTVADFAANAGLPARHTLDPRICRVQSDRYLSIYTYLPGETIPWEAYTQERIKQLGGMLGKLHSALWGYAGQLPSVCDEYADICEHMAGYFGREDVRRAMISKLDLRIEPLQFVRFQRLLGGCARLPDQQALHMDFVRGNLLFDAETLTGILDFEKVAHGHPVFDVARTLAFLLVDCLYKPEEKVRKYFLQSGYVKRGGQPLPDSRLLERLVDLFLVYDFYKFLRHNPYESLRFNQHFLRTVAQLSRRQLISQTAVKRPSEVVK